jgi:4a-hydroxytetrahydrobiopterin dehydratase
MPVGRLSDKEIRDKLTAQPGWKQDGDAVVRQFTFASFPDAIAFTTRLAFDAQEADHHPDLTISYKRVTVRWSTHDQGGVTEKDLAGVAQTDRIATVFQAGTGQ